MGLLLDLPQTRLLLGGVLLIRACGGQKQLLEDLAAAGWAGLGTVSKLAKASVLEGSGAQGWQPPPRKQLRGSAHCQPALRASHSPPPSNSAVPTCRSDSTPGRHKSSLASLLPCIRHPSCQPARPPAAAATSAGRHMRRYRCHWHLLRLPRCYRLQQSRRMAAGRLACWQRLMDCPGLVPLGQRGLVLGLHLLLISLTLQMLGGQLQTELGFKHGSRVCCLPHRHRL